MKTFHLNIVTPAGHVFDNMVTFVSARGQEGSLGILGGHTPIVTLLKPGEVLIRQGKHDIGYDIGAGILEVNAEHNVVILTDFAREKQENH
ncbi:MAG: ATP synthase F1 subunit epsilon [Candidatus Omnitrophica bacterium CG12_big_fil_rev_8_21_14_0_65_50_5]|nr:MAG: ATP synthase F1 subunit epsilon [Candidatus Omnitrophica bacterium CG12_big_fil_rev_8_21_14_0_65_50_5]